MRKILSALLIILAVPWCVSNRFCFAYDPNGVPIPTRAEQPEKSVSDVASSDESSNNQTPLTSTDFIASGDENPLSLTAGNDDADREEKKNKEIVQAQLVANAGMLANFVSEQLAQKQTNTADALIAQALGNVAVKTLVVMVYSAYARAEVSSSSSVVLSGAAPTQAETVPDVIPPLMSAGVVTPPTPNGYGYPTTGDLNIIINTNGNAQPSTQGASSDESEDVMVIEIQKEIAKRFAHFLDTESKAVRRALESGDHDLLVHAARKIAEFVSNVVAEARRSARMPVNRRDSDWAKKHETARLNEKKILSHLRTEEDSAAVISGQTLTRRKLLSVLYETQMDLTLTPREAMILRMLGSRSGDEPTHFWQYALNWFLVNEEEKRRVLEKYQKYYEFRREFCKIIKEKRGKNVKILYEGQLLDYLPVFSLLKDGGSVKLLVLKKGMDVKGQLVSEAAKL